jgi:hypothetical protein
VIALVAPAAAAVALAALVALVFGGHAFVNYDTAYALLWARDLGAGRLPDLEIELAPTPHPLANVLGIGASAHAAELAVLFSVGVCAVLVFALARRWSGPVAGVVAAALFLTREPVLSFGLRAYVDLPYLALVLGALLAVVDRRSPRLVLGLLALAGLLRPEAWLFGVAYVAWRREPRLLVLALAAPVLWALHDLVLTGDPLFSFLGTRGNAEVLERRTGPVDLVLYGPRRLGEVVREPVLVGALIGAVLAWRARTLLPLAALAAALGAFGVLAVAGLPIITRYTLLAGALCCVLAGAAVTRRAGAVVLGALVLAFAPGQVERIDRLTRSIAIQERILDDLDALPAAALRCAPLAVTNRRPVPHLALRFGFVDPAAVRVGPPGRGRTYVGPATQAVAEDFVFDPRDRLRTLPVLPPAYARVAGNRSWVVATRCATRTSRGPGAAASP